MFNCRCYVSCEFLGFFFVSDETTVMRAVKRIEKIAVRVIHIEKKRELTREDAEYLIIDATEEPVRRPEKGKHTLGARFTVGPDGRIFSVSVSYPGTVHDFMIYKERRKRDRFHGIPKKADGAGIRGSRHTTGPLKFPLKSPGTENRPPNRRRTTGTYRRNVSKSNTSQER